MSTFQQTSAVAGRRRRRADDELVVSVVIPCLNEEENIERCVHDRARRCSPSTASPGEVVVADNASEDRSAELAAARRRARRPRAAPRLRQRLPRRLRRRPRPLHRDGATPTSPTTSREIPRFVEQLDEGAELVMGDRMDNIHPGAMPWLHRYVGNPVLTGILNVFFRTGVQRRALRHARAAPRRAAAARPAHDRHGVRLRDGHPGVEGEARHPRVPDRVPPARRREQALELPRRLAPPALPARPQPDAPVHAARARSCSRSAR